jgi:hypothetical protein
MNPKAKKVLAEQGSQVVQALKWIGGAIFGDADDVLDEIAARGDPKTARPPPRASAPRAREAMPPTPPRRASPLPPQRDIIDVEAFSVDEDDE